MTYPRSFEIKSLFESYSLSLPAHTTEDDVEQYLAWRTDKEIPQDEPDNLRDEDNEWLQKAILRRPIF